MDNVFVQSSCFCNHFFPSFTGTNVFSNILKDLLNLHFEEKFETEFELYICNVGDFKDPLKQDLALEFCGNQNKCFSILTETHINHYLILHNKK